MASERPVFELKCKDASSPCWKGNSNSLPQDGPRKQSDGAIQHSPDGSVENKGNERQEMGPGNAVDDEKIVNSGSATAGVFGDGMESEGLGVCGEGGGGGGFWGRISGKRDVEIRESVYEDKCEDRGVLSQMDQLLKETAELKRTLALKIRDNQELEKKVKRLKEDANEIEKTHKVEVWHLRAECKGLEEQIKVLQTAAQDLPCGTQMAEDLNDRKTSGQGKADFRQRSHNKCGALNLTATVEKLRSLLSERDSRIHELEQQDLKGPATMKGELKMLKKDFESAAMYIRQQQEEIEGLKVLLKKSSVASQVERTNSEVDIPQIPLWEASEDALNETSSTSHEEAESGEDDSECREHCVDSEADKTPLRTMSNGNEKSPDEAVVPYYASKMGKICGLRIERGKGIKVNHRLDYLHDPENAPFLLSENKDSAWYRFPTKSGGEKVKMVKLKKRPPVDEGKIQLVKLKRPFSACGAHDTSAQPRKKPNWRTGSAAMAVTDKANGGGYAAKLTVQPVPGAPWEIRQQRKAKPPTVPIPKIMWSDYRAEARKSGFEAYMQKKEEANELKRLQQEKEIEKMERREELELRKARQFQARPMPRSMISQRGKHQTPATDNSHTEFDSRVNDG